MYGFPSYFLRFLNAFCQKDAFIIVNNAECHYFTYVYVKEMKQKKMFKNIIWIINFSNGADLAVDAWAIL